MYLEQLEISCFRNLSRVSLALTPGLNFFWGPNGAGKTAILEAAHVLARGRSFRAHQARTLVQHEAPGLLVRGALRDQGGVRQKLAISKERSGQTLLHINGESERRVSEAARRLPLQVMLPDIADLVFGSPQQRRQWLDWGAFHVKPEYLRVLRECTRALQQRNAGLKQVASGAQPAGTLNPWTERFLASAQAVTDYRLSYVADLAPVFEACLGVLAPELDIRMLYKRGWNDAETLHKVLGDLGRRELKLGATQAGPHRADLELQVGCGAQAVTAASELSRGQGKLVASALKISQARLLLEREGRRSVFLIDDVGAELDDAHNSRFFRLLRDLDCQILATSTRPAGQIVDYFTDQTISVFHVERGNVHGSPHG